MTTAGISRRRLIQGAAGIAVLLTAGKGGQVLAAILSEKGYQGGAEELGPHESNTLRRLVKHLFPYQGLSTEAYQLVVDTVRDDKSVADIAAMLIEGVAQLDDAADGVSWLGLSKAQQITLLEDVEATEFFGFMLDASIHSLHSNQELCKLIGYQGSSVEHGGYIHRGFNDIDWLPGQANE